MLHLFKNQPNPLWLCLTCFGVAEVVDTQQLVVSSSQQTVTVLRGTNMPVKTITFTFTNTPHMHQIKKRLIHTETEHWPEWRWRSWRCVCVPVWGPRLHSLRPTPFWKAHRWSFHQQELMLYQSMRVLQTMIFSAVKRTLRPVIYCGSCYSGVVLSEKLCWCWWCTLIKPQRIAGLRGSAVWDDTRCTVGFNVLRENVITKIVQHQHNVNAVAAPRYEACWFTPVETAITSTPLYFLSCFVWLQVELL